MAAIRASRVKATSTTATLLIALWYAPNIVQLIGERLNEGGSFQENNRIYNMTLVERLVLSGGQFGAASGR